MPQGLLTGERGSRIFSRDVFLFTLLRPWRHRQKASSFRDFEFGAPRALKITEGGRRAEDPFRGLRAGPARSSPRLFSAGFCSPRKCLPFSGARTVCAKQTGDSKNHHSREVGASPSQARGDRYNKGRRWGVVQPVGHRTVNADGEGSNPSAPARYPAGSIRPLSVRLRPFPQAVRRPNLRPASLWDSRPWSSRASHRPWR